MTAKQVRTVCNGGYEVSGWDDFSEISGFFASEQNHSYLPCVVSGVRNCSNGKDKEATWVKGDDSPQTRSSHTKDHMPRKDRPGKAVGSG